MRPGTSDTWLKAAFFGGLWLVGVNAMVIGLGFMMAMLGYGTHFAWAISKYAMAVGFPIWAAGLGALSFRVHGSKRVPIVFGVAAGAELAALGAYWYLHAAPG